MTGMFGFVYGEKTDIDELLELADNIILKSQLHDNKYRVAMWLLTERGHIVFNSLIPMFLKQEIRSLVSPDDWSIGLVSLLDRDSKPNDRPLYYATTHNSELNGTLEDDIIYSCATLKENQKDLDFLKELYNLKDIESFDQIIGPLLKIGLLLNDKNIDKTVKWLLDQLNINSSFIGFILPTIFMFWRKATSGMPLWVRYSRKLNEIVVTSIPLVTDESLLEYVPIDDFMAYTINVYRKVGFPTLSLDVKSISNIF